jgi:hypothetical protein
MRRLTGARRDIVYSKRQVVDFVSKYAGEAILTEFQGSFTRAIFITENLMGTPLWKHCGH